MIRRVATALAGTALVAVLAGCAQPQGFALPELTPYGGPSGAQVYPGQGAGYLGVYPPGYGNVYGYASPYYAAQGPYPYGQGFGYGYGYGYTHTPYPRYVVVPCADGNRDGHCDTRPPKNRPDREPRDDRDHNQGINYPEPRPHEHAGEVPRVRNGDDHEVTPNAQRRAVPVPAPVPQQPARARPEPRRAMPSDAAGQREPRGGSGRAATTGNDARAPRPAQEP